MPYVSASIGGAGVLCANEDGFSLHAEVHVRAHDKVRLEHLYRYVARSPIAAARLSLSPDGKVIYELRRAWRDGTTHFVFDPLTFIERLAAAVSEYPFVESRLISRSRLWMPSASAPSVSKRNANAGKRQCWTGMNGFANANAGQA